MERYQLVNPRIERLLQASVRQPWDVYQQLDWRRPVDLRKITKNGRSFLQELPEFRRLSEKQRDELLLKETVYHLSNLLGGEHKAVLLTAQIITECPADRPDWAYFSGSILADERNHALALSKYLLEKAGVCYLPHPKLKEVLAVLESEGSYEVKLLVGQVALEWTASALLASLLSRESEPLLKAILRRILQDEGRHLAFNHIVFSEAGAARHDGADKRRLEDLLFEAIVACVSSLFAVPVWREYGFSPESCREHALGAIHDRGVIHFYSRVLPIELNRCGFRSDRLTRLLEKELLGRLTRDQWEFEPETVPGPGLEESRAA